MFPPPGPVTAASGRIGAGRIGQHLADSARLGFHPAARPADHLRELLLDLLHLRGHLGRGDAAETDDGAQHEEENGGSGDGSRYPEPLHLVGGGGEREPEQSADEGEEEDVLGFPEEAKGQVHPEGDPRDPQDVATAPR